MAQLRGFQFEKDYNYPKVGRAYSCGYISVFERTYHVTESTLQPYLNMQDKRTRYSNYSADTDFLYVRSLRAR